MNSTTFSFKDKFPGPFCYLRGVDGVDETFDLNCIGTQKHLVSTYFWDAEERCRIITATVTAALNDIAGWHEYDALMFGSMIPPFKKMFSGPFTTRLDSCPGRGPYFDVYCTASQESVIHCYETSEPYEAKQIAEHIANVLNVFLLSGDA